MSSCSSACSSWRAESPSSRSRQTHFAAALGPPDRSHFRLTFSQTFNSLGTFIGPYLGAVLFLKGVEVKHGAVITEEVRAQSLAGIDRAFFWIAGLIILVGVVIWMGRRVISASAPAASDETARSGVMATLRDATSSPWACSAASRSSSTSGAEVAIGTQMAFFLNSDRVWGVPLEDAAKYVSLYWGGAMVGRLVGSGLLTPRPGTEAAGGLHRNGLPRCASTSSRSAA